jgi:hypothetical protein
MCRNCGKKPCKTWIRSNYWDKLQPNRYVFFIWWWFKSWIGTSAEKKLNWFENCVYCYDSWVDWCFHLSLLAIVVHVCDFCSLLWSSIWFVDVKRTMVAVTSRMTSWYILLSCWQLCPLLHRRWRPLPGKGREAVSRWWSPLPVNPTAEEGKRGGRSSHPPPPCPTLLRDASGTVQVLLRCRRLHLSSGLWATQAFLSWLPVGTDGSNLFVRALLGD